MLLFLIIVVLVVLLAIFAKVGSKKPEIVSQGLAVNSNQNSAPIFKATPADRFDRHGFRIPSFKDIFLNKQQQLAKLNPFRRNNEPSLAYIEGDLKRENIIDKPYAPRMFSPQKSNMLINIKNKSKMNSLA